MEMWDSNPSLPEEYWKAEESIAFRASRPVTGTLAGQDFTLL
jgi:hypothetical protein